MYFFPNCFFTDVTNTELCISFAFGFQGLIIFHLSRGGKKKKERGDKISVWEMCQGVLFAQTSKLIVHDSSAA